MLAAERFGLPRLRDRVAAVALRGIDEADALQVLQLAEDSDSPVLRRYVMDYILRHAEGVLSSPDAPKISRDLAEELLSSDDLCLQSEEILFRFLLRWGLQHKDADQDLRSTLLPLVSRTRLGHLALASLRHKTCTSLAPPDMITSALFAKVRWAHEAMEARAMHAMINPSAQFASNEEGNGKWNISPPPTGRSLSPAPSPDGGTHVGTLDHDYAGHGSSGRQSPVHLGELLNGS